MNNNKNNNYLKGEVENKLLIVRSKIALLHPIDIDFNAPSEFMDGVKILSFEINKILMDCIHELELIE